VSRRIGIAGPAPTSRGGRQNRRTFTPEQAMRPFAARTGTIVVVLGCLTLIAGLSLLLYLPELLMVP